MSSSTASAQTVAATKKKSIRELNSIANHLLLTKTLNALQNSSPTTATISSIENTPNFLQEQKSNRNNVPLKPMDNIGTLLQFYQSLTTIEKSSLSSNFSSAEPSQQPTATKKSSANFAPMTFLCRFYQRNRLIEVPQTGEFSHEQLKQLIIQEFQLQNLIKSNLIIQIWNDQYQEFIDIESYKRIPTEGRLQVLIEKEANVPGDSKSPSTPISTISPPDGHRTPSTSIRQSIVKDEIDSSPQIPMKNEQNFDESMNTISPMRPMDNLSYSQGNLMYDLLPKPSDGIPIPRFPPHIAAFLNGNGDANQLNALVQALYQEIVKYELYPNADELRSIVSRLVDRYPLCISVIGSVELLVRKLYYKFCNERKKYPIELKRRQPNKRKRLARDDDGMILSSTQIQQQQQQQQMNFRRQENLSNDYQQPSLDRLMHLWTSTTTTNNGEQGQSPSSSSSRSSSPVSQSFQMDCPKSHPLNLSLPTNNHHFMCTE